jgi:transcription initiation factor TFIID subunit 3
MAVQYSRSLLRIAIAQICQHLGWTAIQSTPLELLTNVLERYVLELGRQSHRYSELFGRTEPNLDDLGLAFQELQVSLGELQDYVRHVDALPFALDIVQFPVPKASHITAVEHDEKELIAGVVVDGLVATSKADFEDGRSSPHGAGINSFVPGSHTDGLQALRSPGTVGVRPFTSPTDAPPPSKRLRILPDEAAHSQYEMKSFARSDSGALYPTGQGKLADACNPVIISTPTEMRPPSFGPTTPVVVLPSKPVAPKMFRGKTKIPRKTWKVPGSVNRFHGMKDASAVVPWKSMHEDDVDFIDNDVPYTELDDGVVLVSEDPRARESRLNAYDDAIDSVIRRAQGPSVVEAVAVAAPLPAHRGIDWMLPLNVEPHVPSPPMADPAVQRAKDERDARISDTIDAVIAGTFYKTEDSLSPPEPPVEIEPSSPSPLLEHSLSPLTDQLPSMRPEEHSLSPPEPPRSPPGYDDEDEIVEVHSESPVVAELSPKVVFDISPSPPSPPPPPPPPPPPVFVQPVRTLAERKARPDDVSVSSAPLLPIKSPSAKSKKPKKSKSKNISRQGSSTVASTGSASRLVEERPPMSEPVERDVKPKSGDWVSENKPATRYVSPVRSPAPASHLRLDEQSVGTGSWSDDDLTSPMLAAESLMTLAGIAAPLPKRLRISYGSGNSRMINQTSDAEDHQPPTPRERKPLDVKTELLTANDHSHHGFEHVTFSHPSPTKQEPDMPVVSKKLEKFEHSKGGKSRDRRDRKEKEHHHHREKSVELVEHRKDKKKKEKEKSKKEHKRHDKDKKPSEDVVNAVPHIPKMTIKFGGGPSGGSQNLVSVCGLETGASVQAPLKLVIRPVATDSPSSSAKPSPQQHVVKGSKQHRHNSPSPSRSSPVPHHSRSFNMLSASRPIEALSQMSPIQFTSSSSSSSSGSPPPPTYRRDIRRSPPPPSLASPAPLTAVTPSHSPASSPSRSSPCSSRSPSPPTLYRSPDVVERLPVFESYTSRGRRSSPPLPAFPSFPPSRYNTSATPSLPPPKPVASPLPVIPTMPPPALKSASKSSSKAKQTVITETVGKLIDDKGEITWICPACKMPDDGSPMIGCDSCDDWYHWPCVGVVKAPPEDEQWFCKRCTESGQCGVPSKGGKAGKGQKSGGGAGGGRSRSKKPGRRK